MEPPSTRRHERLDIDPDTTLNELVARHPSTLGVLTAHGLDTCCGGSKTLAVVCASHGIDLAELTRAIETVVEP